MVFIYWNSFDEAIALNTQANVKEYHKHQHCISEYESVQSDQHSLISRERPRTKT